METLLQDLRYAMRALARTSSITALILVTLAVGIGATTAIFSAVNAILMRPLPYHDPSRIVMLYRHQQQTKEDRRPQSFANYIDIKEQSQTFRSLAAYYGVSLNLTGSGEPERVIGTMASASLFDVLGVQPQLGTVFSDAAEEAGKDQVVLISHDLWQRRFAGDPSIVGQTINLSDVQRQIIGVMPATFHFPHKDAQLWVPLAIDSRRRQARDAFSWFVIGRLKEDVAIEQARQEIDRIATGLAKQYPDVLGSSEVTLIPLHEQVVGDVKPALFLLLGAVTFVLLLACANIANLLLARATARENEMAIRLAVGASRWRIVRPMLTESLLLAALGGALGLAFGYAGLQALVAFSPADLPRIEQVNMDARVVAFALLVSLLTGGMSGLAPALQAARADFHDSLKNGGRGSFSSARGRRLRGLLMISEVALAFILLIGAGLMGKSFLRLHQVKLGFNPDRVVAMNIQLPRSMAVNPAQSEAFFKQLIERVEAVPGVEAAGAISAIFIGSQPVGSKFMIEGRAPQTAAEQMEAPVDIVSTGYFRAMGNRLLEGREFTTADHANSPRVAIINQTFARRFWPYESALGKRLKFGAAESTAPWITIVGVVEDMRRTGLDTDAHWEAFWPHAQSPMGFMTVVTRTSGDPLALVPALHNAVWSLNQDQPISHTMTLERMLADMAGGRRLNTLLFGLFAAVAMLLAAAGIYGVMSYSVAQRTHEIGVRVALGAERHDVYRQIVGEGLRLTAVGLTVGIIGAYFATRLLSSLLFDVSETDPAIFAGMTILLATVALLASFLPARRATKVDPLVALRHE